MATFHQDEPLLDVRGLKTYFFTEDGVVKAVDGVDFQVMVKRWSFPESHWNPREGCQVWNVYAYIYQNHRLFDSFKGSDMFQPASSALPLHYGPTFLEYNSNENGGIAYVRVGSDYRHQGDERFTNCKTREAAWEVFQDAEELFTYLSTNPEDTNLEKEDQ